MEKRKHRRHAKRLRVRYGEGEFTHQAFTVDLSATGMFIQTGSLPKLGTRFHIEVTVEDQKHLYFEGVVVRLKAVGSELRQLLKPGFGVRFLTGAELLSDIVADKRVVAEKRRPAPSAQVLVRYETAEEFGEAWRKELQKGGIFAWSEKSYDINAVVSVGLELPFAAQDVVLACRVMHVLAKPTGHGLTLMFTDPTAAAATLRALAEQP